MKQFTIYYTSDKNNNHERKQKDSEAETGDSESSDTAKKTCTEASATKFSVSGRLVNHRSPTVKILCQ